MNPRPTLPPARRRLLKRGILACVIGWAGLPYVLGLHGMPGLDLANYAARIHLFSQAWAAGDPLPELTRWAGCGEPFVLFNGSLASCLGGLLAWLGGGGEGAVALALRALFVLGDAGAALAAYWGLRQAGASSVGATVGAAAWGFGWLRRGESLHAANLEHVAFLALLPLAGGLLARLVRRPAAPARDVAALALLLALMVPIHPGLAIIAGAQLALACGVAVTVRSRQARISLAAGLSAAAWGALACAWFAGPLLAERAGFGEGVGPVSAEPAASLLDYLDRSLWFSDTGATRFALSPNNYLSSAYAGVSVLGLALVGVALPRARRRAAACLTLALGSALVSLHPSWTTAVFGPVYGLASIRFAAPAYLWLCVGAALGADALTAWLRARTRNELAGVVVAACAGLTVAVDFATLEAQAGDTYRPQPSDPEHPLAIQGALLQQERWETIAAQPPSDGFDRVLALPNYELHQGLLRHRRRGVDGLERHGWNAGARDLLVTARDQVTRALAGAPADLTTLDRLGVRWVTTLWQPAQPQAHGLRLVASDPETTSALYARDPPPPAFGAQARLLSEEDEAFALEVDGAGGPLVIARQFHRRWAATFAGQSAPVTRSPDGLIQVELPPGAGRLDLRLVPWGGRWPTRLATALAWLLGLTVWLLPAGYWPSRLRRLITAAA